MRKFYDAQTHKIDGGKAQCFNALEHTGVPRMATTKISRSPRAPSVDLEEALRKAQKLYEKEGKLAIPADLAVKHLGYSGINNGSAARVLASLKFYGLVDSNNKGDVAASRDVEDYVHTPDEKERQSLLIKWLRAPKVYAELLDEYSERLPSEQAIRYRLIKMGFLPPAANDAMKTFRASVEFARYFERQAGSPAMIEEEFEAPDAQVEEFDRRATQIPERASIRNMPVVEYRAAVPQQPQAGIDRIPVRLSGGRKAAIEVPTPLYEADKEILRRQIDLLFTDDEESESISDQ
jgi:hypothetical protein